MSSVYVQNMPNNTQPIIQSVQCRRYNPRRCQRQRSYQGLICETVPKAKTNITTKLIKSHGEYKSNSNVSTVKGLNSCQYSWGKLVKSPKDTLMVMLLVGDTFKVVPRRTL
jgi:hypothetical protein